MSALETLITLAEELDALAAVRGKRDAKTRWETALRRLRSPGPAAVEVARELASTGWVHREEAIAELPAHLRWLVDAGVVTIAQLRVLAVDCGVATPGDLAAAIAEGALVGVFGEPGGQSADVVAAMRAAVPRIPIGRAFAAVEPVLERVLATAGVVWGMTAGSLRRGQELVGDVEVVVRSEDPAAVLETIARADGVDQVNLRDAARVIVSVNRTQVSWRCPPMAASAPTLLRHTGSADHVAMLEQLARERGLQLTSRGLTDFDGRERPADSESAIYAALGLPWIPPELRNGGDEIERARSGALPDLIERGDILGDLHMHTTWSDGRDSVAAMAAGAVALGYRYIAITDHSPSSAAVKNLQAEDIGRQAEEIARAREQYPQMAILHGCEVDILPDGRLDLPDKVLRRFDIVLASLHDRAGHSPQQLLRRYLGAMVHPLVTLITHPTNRSFPREEGYEMDYERLFEAAVETRTALEIDGSPSHIDLNAAMAARAAARGVTLAIDGDSHAAQQMSRFMAIAVLTARRGGVERRHVLNARQLPEIRALIAAKRSRFPV
jgi:DNA polymerase (family 10)